MFLLSYIALSDTLIIAKPVPNHIEEKETCHKSATMSVELKAYFDRDETYRPFFALLNDIL